MTMATQGTDLFARMTGAAVEMFTLCADVNQKVFRELVDLSATAAKEGVRLYAELQSSAVEAVKKAGGSVATTFKKTVHMDKKGKPGKRVQRRTKAAEKRAKQNGG